MEAAVHKTVNRPAASKPAPAVAPVACAVPTGCVQLQSALRVSSPKDPAEKEAEATANKVMRMASPEPGVTSRLGGHLVRRKAVEDDKKDEHAPGQTSLQRKAVEDDKDEHAPGQTSLQRKAVEDDKDEHAPGQTSLQRKAVEDDKDEHAPGQKPLQRKLQSPYMARFADSVGLIQQRGAPLSVARKAEGGADASSRIAADIGSSRASGAPLPSSVRRFMEPRFRADFSGVRIHTGDKAAQLNRQVGAQAFTVGNQIFFGKDRFRPETHEGKSLIAHELTHTLQQGAAVQRSADITVARAANVYVTSDGKTVELPAGMTAEEAARLEAEAKAAEKKLGKGPPPKPVPDVKKLAEKGEKKEKTKAPAKGEKGKKGAKGKKGEKGKDKAARKAAAAMLGKMKGAGKAALYLLAKGAPVLLKGIGALQKLKQNEQTHDNAGEKLKQSEKAVVIPPGEEQSKANTDQVTVVDSRPKPVADEKKAKQKLTETLADNIPRTIEDVDNFKRDKKAQHMGADVMKVVQGDSTAVLSTFGDVTHTPPPTPTDHVSEDLPPEEIAPPTAVMNLGQGAVAPLQPEHTDVSNFTKEADSKLDEEGVTQAQLDMVDSGDLFKANQEKKGMEAKAKTEPLTIRKFATQEALAVDKDLRQEEKRERGALAVKRKLALGGTKKKQKDTKSALEKKREQVAAKINGIYKTAQDSVKKKLGDLEKESMKRFDDGNAKAARAFEDNVKRELDAYKADRYSGWFGWTKRVKDWALGMDELPRVKEIFDSNRKVFVETIQKLVDAITADQARVIQECKDELAGAKKEIKQYVDKLGPELKDVGTKAAEEMNDKLSELDQFINRKEEELKNNLKDKQTAAVKAIDEKIEKMKEEMSGALSKLGKLLLNAAKKFFAWALEKAGFSLSTIEGVISKGVAVLKAIFTGPIQFVKRLVRAASTGFQNFGKNFLTHLKNAVFEWLTGSLQGIVLPQTWNLKGILSVVFQMLGITYQNIRSRLVKVIPEPVVKTLETTFTLVKTLVTEGPMAAWEQLKQIAGEMKDAFVEAVKDWIKWKLVQKAIETIVAMFIPGAGIVRAIIGIYDTIVFFIQKAKDIIQMVGNFLGSIAEIAAGNIAAAASALETGLARALALVINFLARFLRLTGITKKIQDAIQKVRAKVDAVIDKVVHWIVAQAKRLGKLVVSGAQSAARKIAGWLGLRRKIRTIGKKSHVLFFRKQGKGAQLSIRSVEMSLENFLADLARKYAGDPDKLKEVKKAQALVADIKALTDPANAPAATSPAVDAQVQAKIDQLGPILTEIGDGVSTTGATAAYRGLHWWVKKGQSPAAAAADPDYLANLAKRELGAQQLSDAVRALLSHFFPPGTTPTQAEIDDAIAIVNEKVATLRDGKAYVEQGKTYFDRFHYLVGRYVTKLQAVRTRFASAARMIELDAEIYDLQKQLRTLAKNSREYYAKQKRLKEAQAERRGAANIPKPYHDLAPEVTASPFVATSLSARKSAQYALGSLFTPEGMERRTTGLVGRMLVFVASVVQLVKDGTYSIDELATAGKIKIRKGFSENELMFTGSIPGKYLKATLEVKAGQSEDTVASSAMGRAAAEASRFGGLR